MKRITVALIGLAVWLTGCASDARPRGTPGSGLGPGGERAVAIYGAVLRRLVTVDSTFGEDHRFPVVYVLDRAVPDAGDPVAEAGRGLPFSEDLMAGLRGSLRDLPPLTFVSDRASVIGPQDEGNAVKGGGALVTLGPIPAGGQRVEVPASLYVGNLAATWLTYVVERSDGAWRVSGTTGPVAIS